MRFLSVDHIRGNQERLGRAVDADHPRTYRQAIASLRGFPAEATGIRISFEDDDLARHIVSLGYFDDIFTGIRPSDDAARAEYSEQVDAALTLLSDADPYLRMVVERIVTDVVFMPADRVGGGSGSHLPGIVCVSPGEGWSPAAMAETLIHEAVHLNAFLGEMVNGTYKVPIARLAEPDARVLSAVRIGELRPLDKAFHSALVAVPLMYLQHLRGDSELVDLFTDSLGGCLAGLRQQRRFFTDYGWGMVGDLAAFAESMDYAAVERGLRATDAECESV